MKPTSVRYQRTINLGNYESEQVSVEVALDEGESAADGLRAARSAAYGGLSAHAMHVLSNRYSYSEREVQEATFITAQAQAPDGAGVEF